MNGVNKTILIGRLGHDPECRVMPNGDMVAALSIATSERWKDKNTGEDIEATEWHRVVFFRKLAEICGNYLKKGSLIFVEGKLKTRKWKDKNDIEKYTTEIIAHEMQMLDKKNNNALTDQNIEKKEPKKVMPYVKDTLNDDLPF